VSLRAEVRGPEGFHQLRVQVRRLVQPHRVHVEPAGSQSHGGQEPDRARPQHRRPPGLPHLQAALDLEGLRDPLLHDAGRFEENADLAKLTGDPDQVLGVLYVVLGEEAVYTTDAVFEVLVVGGHVGHPDPVIQARSGPPDPGHDVVPARQLGDVGTDVLDHAEALVSQHQEVRSFRRDAVLAGVDLSIRPVEPHPQHPHHHSPAT